MYVIHRGDMEFLKPLEITEGYVGAASSLRALCFIQRCSRGHTMCFVSLLWGFFFKKRERVNHQFGSISSSQLFGLTEMIVHGSMNQN